MIHYIKRIAVLAFAATVVISCEDNKTTSTEDVEITTMDSTSKVVRSKTEELEEQTKKVEASLEKVDEEFETENK